MAHITLGMTEDNCPFLGAESDPGYTTEQWANLLYLLGQRYFQGLLLEMMKSQFDRVTFEKILSKFLDLEQADFIPAIPPLAGGSE